MPKSDFLKRVDFWNLCDFKCSKCGGFMFLITENISADGKIDPKKAIYECEDCNYKGTQFESVESD